MQIIPNLYENDIKLDRYKFVDIKSTLTTEKEKIITEMTIQNEIVVCKNIFEYSFYLRDSFDFISYKAYNETGTHQKEIDSIIFALYHKCCDYLLSSYELCTSGFINSTIVIQRSILEAIEGIYYLYINANERATSLFIKKEIQELSTEEEREIKRKFLYFKPEFIRKNLYDEAKISTLNDFYKHSSKITHASIRSAFGSYLTDPLFIGDSLRGIIFLGIANIVAFWEANYTTFNQNQITEMRFLLDETSQKFGSLPIDMIPNKRDIINKIKIKNYDQIFNINKQQ